MKLALAQINSLMGHISGNQKKIVQYILQAQQKEADLIIFPELALSAYCPLNLLKRKLFFQHLSKAIHHIHQSMPESITALIGSPYRESSSNKIYNSLFLLKKNQTPKIFSKSILANEGIFEESRFFHTGDLQKNAFSFHKKRVQLLICEELWKLPPHSKPFSQNPQLILSVNASPFWIHKDKKRKLLSQKLAKKYKCPFFYINAVGGQEELIFDGGSFVFNKNGKLLHQSPFFQEDLSIVDLNSPKLKKPKPIPVIEQKIQALVFGLKDFVYKNGFQKVHLGLSGGVDSALVAWLAAIALGSENVRLLFLKGPFTSSLSYKGALTISKLFHSPLIEQDIIKLYQTFLKKYWPPQMKKPKSLTMENIQARLRNIYLMAYSNNHPESLLLGTSNKSELALGYSTLYGDLAGGLLPIGDLLKTEIYELAHSMKNPAIPSFILNRPPSAELKKNQKDEEDIPPYPKLDPVLKKLVEEEKDPSNIFEEKILQQIIHSEFKRKQSPPILKVKQHSFDRGWRWPLSMIGTSMK